MCSCAPRSVPRGQNELRRNGPMVGAVERVNRDIADADPPIGEHVVDRDRRRYPAARWPGRDLPLSGLIRRIEVAGVEDVAELIVVERRVEVAGQDPERPVGVRPGKGA